MVLYDLLYDSVVLIRHCGDVPHGQHTHKHSKYSFTAEEDRNYIAKRVLLSQKSYNTFHGIILKYD